MDAREFLTIAGELARRPDAAAQRTAISRAYYAAFNTGAQFLRSCGFRIGKGAAAHGEVYRCLSFSGHTELARAGSDLNDLHSLRNRADYQLDRTDVERPKVALAAVELSWNLIQNMTSAFGGPERVLIEATIAKWRKDNGYP